MTTKDQVDSFLKDFKEKMKIWNILFRDDRAKNTQALADLEITPIDRKYILNNLSADDFSEGPLVETLYGGSNMWIFGKEVKNQEVFIKISMGFTGASVLCISFHIAENPLQYPFKEKE
ncbi:MAG: toxin [Bacteroidota bacterium]|jgi:hypothetical protein